MSAPAKNDGKLHKAFVPLIRGKSESKPRALHLDELDADEDRPLRPTIERLFDDPEA